MVGDGVADVARKGFGIGEKACDLRVQRLIRQGADIAELGRHVDCRRRAFDLRLHLIRRRCGIPHLHQFVGQGQVAALAYRQHGGCTRRIPDKRAGQQEVIAADARA